MKVQLQFNCDPERVIATGISTRAWDIQDNIQGAMALAPSAAHAAAMIRICKGFGIGVEVVASPLSVILEEIGEVLHANA